jgi:hypothetical protein
MQDEAALFELRCCRAICLVVLRNTRSSLVGIGGRRAEILMFDQKSMKKVCIERESVIHRPCRYELPRRSTETKMCRGLHLNVNTSD